MLSATTSASLCNASCRIPFIFLSTSSSLLFSHEITLPSITTSFPSKTTRERPSQFVKVSHTRGCWGWKVHCARLHPLNGTLHYIQWGVERRLLHRFAYFFPRLVNVPDVSIKSEAQNDDLGTMSSMVKELKVLLLWENQLHPLT